MSYIWILIDGKMWILEKKMWILEICNVNFGKKLWIFKKCEFWKNVNFGKMLIWDKCEFCKKMRYLGLWFGLELFEQFHQYQNSNEIFGLRDGLSKELTTSEWFLVNLVFRGTLQYFLPSKSILGLFRVEATKLI